jgi:hypothetical protein
MIMVAAGACFAAQSLTVSPIRLPLQPPALRARQVAPASASDK